MLKKTDVLTLDERALLVKLSISQWSARKTDREVSNEVIESKQAKKGSGYFSKYLIDRDALKKIGTIAGAARSSHYELTLPWSDDGSRIITTENYQKYAKTMREYRITMQNAVEEFLDGYDDFVKQAKKDMGKLFNETDYPTKDEIRSKFSLDVEAFQVPKAADFRAKVGDKEAKAIAADIERRTKQRLDAAVNDVWKRIVDVVEKMAERLSNYKPAAGLHPAENNFHSSLVENIRNLVEVLPSLNINGDPELTKITDELESNLCLYDAEELKTDTKARAHTAKKAKEIHKKVSKYMM